jgi:hypothetical protein
MRSGLNLPAGPGDEALRNGAVFRVLVGRPVSGRCVRLNEAANRFGRPLFSPWPTADSRVVY